MATLKPLKGGKWRIQWYDGQAIRHRLIFPTKAQAKEQYELVCGAKLFEKTGLKPALGMKAQNFKRKTFRELAEKYAQEHLAQTRAAGNISYIHTLIAKWGDWRLSHFSPEQVRPWLLAYLNGPVNGRKWAISSVKKLAAYMKRVFSYGCESGFIHENPLAHLINSDLRRRFRRVNRRTRTISQEQFWKLEKALPQWLQRICLCAWSTGMRSGEVINLRWRDIDLVDRLIRLEAKDTKEADFKTIGIEQALYELLIQIETERLGQNRDDYVFLGIKGAKINHHFMDRKFRKLADDNGCEGLVIHDFRHCYVTRKRRSGHDKSVIKANTGHKTDSMYSWYNVVDDHEIQELAGYTDRDISEVKTNVIELVESAKESEIPLEAVQALIAKMWKVRA